MGKEGRVCSEVGMHDHCLSIKSIPPRNWRRYSCFGVKRRTVRKRTTDITKRSLRRVNPMFFADVEKPYEEEDSSSWETMSVFSGLSPISPCSSDYRADLK